MPHLADEGFIIPFLYYIIPYTTHTEDRRYTFHLTALHQFLPSLPRSGNLAACAMLEKESNVAFPFQLITFAITL